MHINISLRAYEHIKDADIAPVKTQSHCGDSPPIWGQDVGPQMGSFFNLRVGLRVTVKVRLMSRALYLSEYNVLTSAVTHIVFMNVLILPSL